MKKITAIATLIFSGIMGTTVYGAEEDYRKMDLRKESTITADEIDAFIEKKTKNDSPLIGHGDDFKDVEEQFGVNAQYLAAHAMLESNYGRSKIAVQKHNLFGLGARGKDPIANAKSFPSYDSSISYNAKYVRESYLEEDGKYYNGSTLIGMNKRYAADQKWSQKIAKLMEEMKTYDEEYYEAATIMEYNPKE